MPMGDPSPAAFERTLRDFLVAHGLARVEEPVVFEPLNGGVSSDIWRVDLPGRSLCVKRALPKLKVAADWQAPVNRNAYEWAWLCFAAEQCPDHVPQPLAQDTQAGLFAMAFLAPQQHPVWKQQLLDGVVSETTASQVGALLARLHATSAARPALAAVFDSGANFHALRLEPYLLATAERHPAVAGALRRLSERTAAARIALVHGDVSPKNILVGPQGPVFLDAECAWYGDPAFDIAFCLNHLLLKALVRPDRTAALRAAFAALGRAYLAGATWESPEGLEARAAALLPGLLLARCDGKSPVEYLAGDADRERIRRVALPLLRIAPARLEAVAQAWFDAGPEH